MSLILKPAPDFSAQALLPNGTFKKVSLGDYRGRYVLLFFYPLDFTFVCPTEIIAFSDAADQFEKLGVQILGASIDSEFTHLAWVNTPRKEGGLGNIKYPLLSDLNRNIARDYGVLLEDAGHAVRGVFLIDKNGIVMHETINAPPIGRNVEEELRTVKALQFFEKNGEVCPANWHEGDKGINADPKGKIAFFEQTYK
jgi:alkyl hydroperoxide reductase subunit AhpC